MNQVTPGRPLRAVAEATPVPDYLHDFALWLNSQASLLRAGQFDLLDIDNLAEEIDCMGRNLHRELRSRLKVVLVHLLKFAYQPDHQSHSWLDTLGEQRDQVVELINDSPSLDRHVMDYAEAMYKTAVAKAARETGLAPTTFPTANPYSKTEMLDPGFIPGRA